MADFCVCALGLEDKGACRGERRHSTCATASHLRRETDVWFFPLSPSLLFLLRMLPFVALSLGSVSHNESIVWLTGASRRADDKSAADYQLEGGATLHLVLALRGGL